MSVQKSQHLKLLKIWEILCKETDETHAMSTSTLIKHLGEIGIPCDRRTIYSDIKVLNENGYTIKCRRKTGNEYYVEKREFSIAEVRILMDAVQAASFITEGKTEVLVDKIADLAGSYRSDVIKENIVAFNTTKSQNEDVYASVSTIAKALNEHKKIEFLYFDYDNHGKKVYRMDGKTYKANPLATVYSNDCYYLLCYYEKYGNIVHYRIDRMDVVRKSLDDIVPSPNVEGYDIGKHKKQLFGMFIGEEESVSFDIDESLLGVVFDKFGPKTQIFATNEGKYRFTADVQISPVFLGWCCSFGDKLKVIYPTSIVEKVKDYISSLKMLY